MRDVALELGATVYVTGLTGGDLGGTSLGNTDTFIIAHDLATGAQK
jgi:hypothetical protein